MGAGRLHERAARRGAAFAEVDEIRTVRIVPGRESRRAGAATAGASVPLAQVALPLRGMRDDACARCIEGAIGLIQGVREVRVSLTMRTARVLFEPGRVHGWQFARAVRAMGYELEPSGPDGP